MLRYLQRAQGAVAGCMLMDVPSKEFVLAGSLEELKAKGRLVVHGGHRPILVIYDRGRSSPSTIVARTWASRSSGGVSRTAS
jgi:hypothetical protein